jgi:hypothetical protein
MSLVVPLSSDLHCHFLHWFGWGTELPLPRHCCHGEATGEMEGTAAVLSAASPSSDEMPSSSQCQPRQGEQKCHQLN